MFSACEALKMHLSDDTALSSKEMVCSLYSSAFEQLKVNLYVCVSACVCVCACVCACTFNSMSVLWVWTDAGPGSVQVCHLKKKCLWHLIQRAQHCVVSIIFCHCIFCKNKDFCE